MGRDFLLSAEYVSKYKSDALEAVRNGFESFLSVSLAISSWLSLWEKLCLSSLAPSVGKALSAILGSLRGKSFVRHSWLPLREKLCPLSLAPSERELDSGDLSPED